MKKIIVLLFVVFLGSALPCFAQPVIGFSEESHDFGMVDGRSSLDYSFEIRNTGSSDLVIEKVTTPCACTAVLGSSKRIKPGEKGMVKVTLDPDGYNGKVVKEVWVFSNDPKKPKSVLRVSADVMK
jgi:hypothetical protein